ncbi:MAG: PilX N-terminal domain-containing pilus assembly protein [Rudaea sp.]|nr:PilX N-terminal domain-containing pilus assembly protein [Rudaea sp.]
MRRTSSNIPSLPRQRGAVLFVALVFLVLITLLGLTGMSTSILQERMTGGMHNNQLSLMGADSALRSTEWSVWNASNIGNGKLHCGPTGGDAFCYQANNANASGTVLMNPLVTTFRTTYGWVATAADGGNVSTANLTGLTGSQTSASLAQQPQYLIEELGKVLQPGAPSNGEGGGRDNAGNRGAGSQTLYAYRITSRATGGNQGTVRLLESYFVALPPSF